MNRGLLLLLPPSETKRDGGNAASEAGDPAPGALRFPQLAAVRERTRRDLVALCRDAPAARAALKLSERLAGRELVRNLELADDPPLMPAVLRYTGVLYDALDAGSLDTAARGWLAGHVAVQSALYGLTGANEPIAAYRLSAGSRLPGESLRALPRKNRFALCRTCEIILLSPLRRRLLNHSHLRSPANAPLSETPSLEAQAYTAKLYRLALF